jgi:probable HAF family extracellular repeat protein
MLNRLPRTCVSARNLGLLILACCPARLVAQVYTITDLGLLPSSHSAYALSINNKGQVVGYMKLDATYYRAFMWENGQIRDLGIENSQAVAINNLGHIIGTGTSGTSFLWKNGVVTNLSASLGAIITVTDVNDAGHIAGYQLVGSPRSFNVAVLVRDGVATQLGFRLALGLNNKGDIVGRSPSFNDDLGEAVLRRLDGTIVPLRSYNTDISTAISINDAGQIVGYSYLPGRDGLNSPYHAILWQNGTFQDLGTFGGNKSSAYSINNSGVIVGNAETRTPGQFHAFVHKDGQMVDLNDRIINKGNWELREAREINDSGQIVGYGIFGGADRAFLLTPAPEVHPDRGGNTGPVTVAITLPSIQSGTTARLTGFGPDILGTNMNVTSYSNQSVLRATFDLKSAPVGPRSIALAPPTGSPTNLTNAFTILQGGSAEVWTDILGFNRIAINREPTFHIVYGNRGNIDEPRGKLWVSFSSFLSLASTFGHQPSVVGQRSNEKYIAFDITDLPPDFIGVVPLRFLAAGGAVGTPFEIRAWKETP